MLLSTQNLSLPQYASAAKRLTQHRANPSQLQGEKAYLTTDPAINSHLPFIYSFSDKLPLIPLTQERTKQGSQYLARNLWSSRSKLLQVPEGIQKVSLSTCDCTMDTAVAINSHRQRKHQRPEISPFFWGMCQLPQQLCSSAECFCFPVLHPEVRLLTVIGTKSCRWTCQKGNKQQWHTELLGHASASR